MKKQLTEKQLAVIEVYGELLQSRGHFTIQDVAVKVESNANSIRTVIRGLKESKRWPHIDKETKGEAIIRVYGELLREEKLSWYELMQRLGETNERRIRSLIHNMIKGNKWPHSKDLKKLSKIQMETVMKLLDSLELEKIIPIIECLKGMRKTDKERILQHLKKKYQSRQKGDELRSSE
jgi:hypothetical protein